MSIELEKIEFKNNQEPPISAEILNQMQKNIEDAINKINVIETITNENGTAIKYPDGRMECIISKKVTDMAINSQYGNLYTGTYTLDYPVPFAKIPFANCGTLLYGTSASWGTVQSSSIDKVAVRGYDYFSRAAGTETIIRVFATGYWK